MSELQPTFHGELDPSQYALIDGQFVKIQPTEEVHDEEPAPRTVPRRKIAKAVLMTTLAVGIPVTSYAAGHIVGDGVVKVGIHALHWPGAKDIDPTWDQLRHDLLGGK